MEILIAAASAAGILALIAFLSPGVERERRPVHSMVGRDLHERRMQRASLAAQVTQRNAPRPLRMTGEGFRPIEELGVVAGMASTVPASAFMASVENSDVAEPVRAPTPAPAVVAPRLGWARQASESSSRNLREHQADGLVASLLGPTAQA
jgi:hypothetical protein